LQGPALLQAPLSRFGDTAANAGMLALLASPEPRATPALTPPQAQHEATCDAPVALQTAAASLAAGAPRAPLRAGSHAHSPASFRVALMPIDTLKTVLQVEGAAGGALLRAKLAASGPGVLFSGALGAASASLVSHWPWFAVYNTLNARLPLYDRRTELAPYLLRNASIGFAASAVSDTVSNSIRVLKVTKQSHATAITYPQALRLVVAADGVSGLFFRGLRTKIMARARARAPGRLGSWLARLTRARLRRRTGCRRPSSACCGGWVKTRWRRRGEARDEERGGSD